MLPRKIFLLLLALLHLCAAAAVAGTAEDDLSPLRRLPRELIVLLEDRASAPTPEAVVESAAARRPLPADLGVGSPRGARYLIPPADRQRRSPSEEENRLLRYVVLEYASFAELQSVKAALEANPQVAWVDFNWPLDLSATPNDPLFAITLSPETHQWGMHSLKMPEAWDYNKGHAYVGVVDTGLDTTHPDLKTYSPSLAGLSSLGAYRRQYSADYGYPGDSCSIAPGNDCAGQPIKGCADEGQSQVENGVCRTPVRGTGHGTHVSGIAAAATNNGEGVSGACWNCSLIVSKVSRLSEFGSTGQWGNGQVDTAALVAGLNGAVERGAQVVNLSLGLNAVQAPDCTATPLDPLCTAVAKARSRDVVMAAAAGNDSHNRLDFPASDPRVIGVGGINDSGAFWHDCAGGVVQECGSNFETKQLLAPAKQVLSTFYRGIRHQIGANVTCPGSITVPPSAPTAYGLCTGTSMSAPHIAGAAGLLRSVNPLLSADQVAELLRANLDNPPAWDPELGHGKPHVSNAVKAALGKSAGAQLPNRLTPLFSLYSSAVEDHFYTTAPQMAATAVLDAALYQSIGSAVAGYSAYPGAECLVGPCFNTSPTASVYVFTGERAPYVGAPPLVPLYRLTYRGANPNGNAAHRDSAFTTELAGVKSFGLAGYELDGVEGFIYQKCTPEPACMPPGTVRLLRRYNPERDDFAIFPESELAAMELQGYDSTGGYLQDLGYVYPATDTDGDTLIDGFERLAGTEPSVMDSDCDSLSDGQELLNFGTIGYRDPLSSPGCNWMSRVVSQSVPSAMVARRVYPVSASFKNVGSQTWSPVGSSPCGDFRIGSISTDGSTFRGQLPAPVAPGATTAATFDVVAPTAAGNHTLQFRMLQECVQWFGATSPAVAVTVSPAPAKGAQFRLQTVPTTMTAGQTYSVSVRYRNVGENNWSPFGGDTCGNYRLGSVPDGSATWGYDRHELGALVTPGGAQTLTFNVTAPLVPGTYPFQWRMLQECAGGFGDLSPLVMVTVQP